MQYITKRSIVQLVRVRLHVLVVFSIVVLALMGHMLDSQVGWITCPVQRVSVASRGQRCMGWGGQGHGGCSLAGRCWLYLARSWHLPLLRSLLLWGLWPFSGRSGPVWIGMVPWLVWLWQGMRVLWPWLGRQPEWRGMMWLLWQGQRLLMIGYLGLAMGSLLRLAGADVPRPVVLGMANGGSAPLVLGLGRLVCVVAKSRG